MNVNLWFARDNHGEITTIINSNNENTYTCPICNSEVIPKALESKQITPHFAHIDRNKCTGESFIHFWMKHGFIERGDTFTIISDDKHTFTCKDYKTEVTYQLDSGTYRPDVVVETECGNEIVFEMANTNKKKVQDYIDRWIELDKIVVEVDIQSLTNESNIKEFKALYYDSKCFNFNKRDGGYYNTIGKIKEEMKQNDRYDIELVKKLDWFWEDLIKYNTGEININDLRYLKDILRNGDMRDIIEKILKKKKCTNILTEYRSKILNETKEYISTIIEDDNFLNLINVKIRYDYMPAITFGSNLNKLRISQYIDMTKEGLEDAYNKFKFMNDLRCYLNSKIEVNNIVIEYNQFQSSYKGEHDCDISIYSNKTTKHYTIDFKTNIILRRYPRYMEREVIYKGSNLKEASFKIISENYLFNTKLSDLTCNECSNEFSIKLSEFDYFKSKGLHLPKRCKSCRQKRKQNK